MTTKKKNAFMMRMSGKALFVAGGIGGLVGAVQCGLRKGKKTAMDYVICITVGAVTTAGATAVVDGLDTRVFAPAAAKKQLAAAAEAVKKTT